MVDTNGYHSHTYSYDILKKFVKYETVDSSILARLKELFAADIGSVRRLESIRSIEDLVDRLERLDVLNEYNIDALREIADNMDSSKIQVAVASYVTPKELTITAEPTNWYRKKRLEVQLRESLNIASSSSDNKLSSSSVHCQKTAASAPCSFPVKGFTEKQRQAVYKLLSREIGMSWRFFGRELGVGEGEIDAVELQFPSDLPSRIFKLLQSSEEDGCHKEAEQQSERICKALNACGRKDLRRKVKQIIDDLM